jgi:hypothetical protein
MKTQKTDVTAGRCGKAKENELENYKKFCTRKFLQITDGSDPLSRVKMHRTEDHALFFHDSEVNKVLHKVMVLAAATITDDNDERGIKEYHCHSATAFDAWPQHQLCTSMQEFQRHVLLVT